VNSDIIGDNMDEKDDQKTGNRPNRRGFLTLGAAAVAGGLAGFGSGYSLPRLISRKAQPNPPGGRRFKARKKAILELHNQQTPEAIERLKERYQNPIFGKTKIWDLIEKLALCVDPTDDSLYSASQYVHIQQTVAAMERDRITDPVLYVAAFTHDLGKVTLLTDELPENIVGQARLSGKFKERGGLDQVTYLFCHPEIIYLRLKAHVPDHLAWLLRYHNIEIDDSSPYMDERDREYTKKYLQPLQKYDRNFKSYTYAPPVDLKKYRQLIEETFPETIEF
jgi:hypothetical protein